MANCECHNQMVIDGPQSPKSPNKSQEKLDHHPRISQDIQPVKLCCVQTITIPFLLGTRIMAIVEYVVLEINIYQLYIQYVYIYMCMYTYSIYVFTHLK